MTVYRTCHSCAWRDDCEIKKRISESIAGLGVTTLKHKCTSYIPFLKPGQHVWARVGVDDSDISDREGYIVYATFPAVFIQFRNKLGGAVVYIETGAESRCGRFKFEPFKSNACAVTYGPLRSKYVFESLCKRAIVGLREGETPICGCNNPIYAGHVCNETDDLELGGEVA